MAELVIRVTRVLTAVKELNELMRPIIKTRTNDVLDPLTYSIMLKAVSRVQKRSGPKLYARDEVIRALDQHDASVDNDISKDASEAFKLFVAMFVDAYPILQSSSVINANRFRLSDMWMIVVAQLWHLKRAVRSDSFSDARGGDFEVIRNSMLLFDAATPITMYSVHTTMNALYALYRGSPYQPYSGSYEEYTMRVLERAAELLLEPNTEQVWNVHALREPIEDKFTEKQWEEASGRVYSGTTPDAPVQLFRYSPLFLSKVCSLFFSFANHFDVAHLLPRQDDAYALYKPSAEKIWLVRQWLQRYAVTEVDTWVQDRFVSASLRCGEEELWQVTHRGQHSTPHSVIRDHREAEFRGVMEAALKPMRKIIDDDIGPDDAPPKRQTLQLSLASLALVRLRISACAPTLKTGVYTVLGSKLRTWQALLLEEKYVPRLVLLFGHVQLWHNGLLYMYNNAVEAICAWMHIVESYCLRELDHMNVGELVDECMRPKESDSERLTRVAALRGQKRPALHGLY